MKERIYMLQTKDYEDESVILLGKNELANNIYFDHLQKNENVNAKLYDVTDFNKVIPLDYEVSFDTEDVKYIVLRNEFLVRKFKCEKGEKSYLYEITKEWTYQ